MLPVFTAQTSSAFLVPPSRMMRTAMIALAYKMAILQLALRRPVTDYEEVDNFDLFSQVHCKLLSLITLRPKNADCLGNIFALHSIPNNFPVMNVFQSYS